MTGEDQAEMRQEGEGQKGEEEREEEKKHQDGNDDDDDEDVSGEDEGEREGEEGGQDEEGNDDEETTDEDETEVDDDDDGDGDDDGDDDDDDDDDDEDDEDDEDEDEDDESSEEQDSSVHEPDPSAESLVGHGAAPIAMQSAGRGGGDVGRTSSAEPSQTSSAPVDTSDIIKKLSSAKSEREAEMRGAFLIVFESLDKDHGGTLDVDGELLTGLHSLGQDVVLADLRLAMESVIKRPHDRMVKTGVFQKVKVWDEITEEEFVDVMLMLSKPSEMEEKRNLERDLLRVFREFDVDQSGNIDGQELGLALEKLGRKMSEEEVTALLNQFDQDGSGEIGFVEFASIFGVEVEEIDYEAAEKGEAMQKLREAHAAFKAFDADGSNSVDATELGIVLKTMGKQMTKKEVDEMLSSVDEDGSGEIDFKEFCQLLEIEWLDEFGDEIGLGDEEEERGGDPRELLHVHHGVDRNFYTGMSDGPPACLLVCSDPSGVSSIRCGPRATGRQMSIAVCGMDESVKLIDVAGPRMKKVATLRAHRHAVLEAAWSPDGTMIVTGGADKSIMIFDAKTGQVLHEAKAHTAYVRSVDWCCNGDLIASGSSDKSVKLWAAPSLATSKQLLGHSSWVRFVRFSPKADRLVSGGGDSVIILWSVPEGQILQRIAWHEATLSTACWLRTPKNQAVPPLATADRDGHVNLWQHDRGMAGIMHMTIISIDKLPSSANNVHRYCILSVGRNRESIATQPRPGSSHDFTHESATHDMSIAVWDQYEVIRIQLFEKDEDGHRASLLGEHRLAHRDIILMEPEERLNYSFGLVNGESDMVEDENKVATHVRMRFRFEHTEHQANLTVDVEDAKNVKLDQPGPVNSLCKVGTEAGQEFFTKVVMNSAMPSWHSSFTLGIGPATKEITVSLLLLERSGEALELGSSQLKMERLLQKVCSQQEPLEGWYVMRSGLDQRSRGVVRLRFRHSEAKKRSTLCLSFPSLVSGVRSDKTTRFAPTNRIKALKWTLWSGRCRHCKRYEREHGIEGVCRPVEHGHEKKVGVTSMASSSDGRLIAWGTETGYIEIATSDTADIVGSWHAHFRDVASLDFSADDTLLFSSGQDVFGPRIGEGLSAAHEAVLPRKHQVLAWDMKKWISSKLKSRL